MKEYRADLHIHTLLSPCGDLEMSPANIISEALRKKLDIIGITDHNSTRQASVVKRLGDKKGIFVMRGAEVTTTEEVHCLAFFEKDDTLEIFQLFLDDNIPDFENNPLLFGDQVAVDENEIIIYTENRLLINATEIPLDVLSKWVLDHDGIFIPAHIDRMKNSIYSQLGFLPDDLVADALEVSKRTTPASFATLHPEIRQFTLVTNSDSHYPQAIGRPYNTFLMKSLTFEEVRLALKGENGRKTIDHADTRA
ncbi:MAG: histidinol-phosphatase [Bacteroidales bacterium]|jgi:PHP family Zn ribbon phosphoesterase|nr:histidinol-phosphatase [Bacteroidales bacterium]